MSRKVAGVFIAMMMSALFASAVWAGEWKEDSGKYWYEKDDGSRIRQEIREIDGVRYAFDSEGYRVSGWYKFSSQWYYYSPESGKMAYGWLQDDDKWYYLDERDGFMFTGGPKRIDKKLYYFRWDNGQMRQGEIFCACDTNPEPPGDNRSFYQANADGTLKCNEDDRNPNNPYEIVRYDMEGRITAYNKEKDYYELLRCDNPEHNPRLKQHLEEEARKLERDSSARH